MFKNLRKGKGENGNKKYLPLLVPVILLWLSVKQMLEPGITKKNNS
jgi:hypothetical protein